MRSETIENKDEEDHALERDEEIWEMIHKRRKETKTIPLAEVKKRLGLDKPGRRKNGVTNKE